MHNRLAITTSSCSSSGFALHPSLLFDTLVFLLIQICHHVYGQAIDLNGVYQVKCNSLIGYVNDTLRITTFSSRIYPISCMIQLSLLEHIL